MTNSIKVYIVDDHNLFREGLKFLLSKIDFISEIFEAQNGQEILDNLSSSKPDVILMDIEMPILNGIETTRKIIEINNDAKIIALSMHDNENFYLEMIDAGAKGFLLKNSKFEDVKKAISDVYSGKTFFSPEVLDSIMKNLISKKKRRKNTDLTDREIEILYNICKGFSNQQIADNLYISKRTVDKHRENVLLKTQSKNTAELVIFAIKNGIFEI